MQAARLVAELVNADGQHVQHPAGRLRAAGLCLNVQSRLRDFVEPIARAVSS
jgi:hypothetical protein